MLLKTQLAYLIIFKGAGKQSASWPGACNLACAH